MLVKIIRNALGLGIVGVDRLTRPKAMQRAPEEQIKAQELADNLSLYNLARCPFCVKTRRAIHVLGVDIELRDIRPGSSHRQVLQEEGGRVMVPCLRIEEEGKVRWMYESKDIIVYLNQRFAAESV